MGKKGKDGGRPNGRPLLFLFLFVMVNIKSGDSKRTCGIDGCDKPRKLAINEYGEACTESMCEGHMKEWDDMKSNCCQCGHPVDHCVCGQRQSPLR